MGLIKTKIWNLVYKTGLSFTKVDFRLQIGTLEIQTGLSGCYLPFGYRGSAKNPYSGGSFSHK